MRRAIHRKRQSVVFACLAVLLAAGAWHGVRADGQDDDHPSNDFRVIGLTDDGRLVSFRARSPERTRDLGFITRRWTRSSSSRLRAMASWLRPGNSALMPLPRPASISTACS